MGVFWDGVVLRRAANERRKIIGKTDKPEAAKKAKVKVGRVVALEREILDGMLPSGALEVVVTITRSLLLKKCEKPLMISERTRSGIGLSPKKHQKLRPRGGLKEIRIQKGTKFTNLMVSPILLR